MHPRALLLLCVLAAGCGSSRPGPPPPPPEVFKRPDIPPSDPRAIQLRGRVLDPSGRPVANAPVLVIAGGHSGERPITNAAGEFQVAGLPPTLQGYVAVHVPGYAVQVREPVKVNERTPDSVTLRLEPEQVIEGVVTDPDGHPLARAKVEVRGERRLQTPLRKGASWEAVAQIDSVRTDEQGRFRLAGLYPSEFELTARWPRALDACATIQVRAGVRDARVRIDPKQHDQVLFVGRVLDAATRAPIAGAEVRASSDAPAATGGRPDAASPPTRHAVTDADGAFVLGPFPASLFHLSASYRPPGAPFGASWRQAGAREPGLHRLEIELAPDGN